MWRCSTNALRQTIEYQNQPNPTAYYWTWMQKRASGTKVSLYGPCSIDSTETLQTFVFDAVRGSTADLTCMDIVALPSGFVLHR